MHFQRHYLDEDKDVVWGNVEGAHEGAVKASLRVEGMTSGVPPGV